MKDSKSLRVAGAVAAFAALGSIFLGGTASAEESARGAAATIDIKGNNHPRFEGPETVDAGQQLEIVNNTDPDRIGPHSFSLFERSELPRGRDEMKRCGQIKGLCKRVANDHGVFPPNDFEVDNPVVDNGSAGWDTSYDRGVSGDSWLTLVEDETHSRAVTAGPGNLRYLCIVHPDMQGKIKVLPVR